MPRNKYSIEDMVELATKRNGEFLSEHYQDAHTKVKWRCEKGHEWMASSNSIRKGSWCPTCSGVKKLSLNDMHIVATSQGGECLSKEYINIRTKLEWKCAHGHTWNASPMKIKMGTWCPTCAGNKKLSIDAMRDLAKAKGGKCLSESYVNIRTKLKWVCDKGHHWEVAPIGIKNGSWCPECAKVLRKNKKGLKSIKNFGQIQETISQNQPGLC